MNETINHLKSRYNVVIPVSWSELCEIRKAAKKTGMTVPKFLRRKLNLDEPGSINK